MKRKILITLILFVSLCTGKLIAQTPKLEARQIKPIQVKAEVIALLENTNNLAVLRILEVDSNHYMLRKDDEVLTTFMFSTGPTDGDPRLPGVKKGSIIQVEMAGENNEATGQIDYTAFRYSIVSPVKDKKKP